MSGEAETRARELGWVPQEEFRGDQAKWVDAETFVRRGEEMLPLLRKHNKDLEGQVTTLNGELTTLKQLFKETQDSVKELGKFHTEETARQVEAARKELKAQLIAARESGDHALELEVQEQLDDIRDAQRAAPPASATPPPPAPAPAAAKEDPIWVEWKANKAPWFGKDSRKSALLVATAEELRRNGDTSSGVAFFDKALADMEEYLGSPGPRQKVEGSGGGGGGGSGSGSRRSYTSLPADAKSACDGMEKKFVGAGKAFKTPAEWRSHYVEQYYASGE